MMQYFRYLDLLAMLCVCDGVAIPDNQNYITKMWLQEGDKVTSVKCIHILNAYKIRRMLLTNVRF